MTLPGLGLDTVTVTRGSSFAADAEGNPTFAQSTIFTGRGTWGSPRTIDQQTAAQRGQQLDAVVAMPTADVQPGDELTVRGLEYVVVDVRPLRTHMRVFVREAS